MTERKLGGLKKYSFSEAASELPRVEPMEAHRIETPNIFITALGFEDRVLHLPKLLSRNWSSTCHMLATAIVGKYSTNMPDNERNLPELVSTLSDFCGNNIRFVEADNPSKLASDLSYALAEYASQKTGRLHVVFDISGSSSNFILSVMYSLVEMAQNISLTVVYAEAKEYHPLFVTDANEKIRQLAQACDIGDSSTFVEHGVQDPKRNELYPGRFHDSRPDYVIAIPSYRTHRMLRCLQMIGDQVLAVPKESIYWIFGVPPGNHNAWRHDFQRETILHMLRQISGSGNAAAEAFLDHQNSSDCSTLDYIEIIGRIMEVVDRNLGKRVSLIDMGSKMQSLGVALALAVRDEVGVTAARPGAYNPGMYSSGAGPCWQLRMDEFDRVILSLRKVGMIKYVPASGSADRDRPSA